MNEHARYLGCLNLLCECSIALRDTSECTADELRDCIAQALDDATKAGTIRGWKRVLHRMEIVL